MDNSTNRQPAIGQGNRRPANPMFRRARTEIEQQENNDIVALCPADGWKAYYFDDHGKLFAEPLVGWVIHDSPDTIGREIRPAVWSCQSEIDIATCFDGCSLGCLAPGEKIPRHWKKQVRIERQKYLVSKKNSKPWMAWLISWF